MSKKTTATAFLMAMVAAQAAPVLAEGHAGASGANNKTASRPSLDHAGASGANNAAVVRLAGLLGGRPIVIAAAPGSSRK